MIKQLAKDRLCIHIFENRALMGQAAARDIADCMDALLREKETINMVFAAAPSQRDMLDALVKISLPWHRVNAFHMDEYVGLAKDDPRSFSCFLDRHIFKKVTFANVFYVADYGLDYGSVLAENPPDIVCLGIGENGHIAFNDPGVADFNDPLSIKLAKLDDVCRMQQVHDGCFPTLADVPEYAYTLTVPQMTAAGHMFCVVPADTKAEAVYNTVTLDITDQCPATILRRHDHADLYCDADSGKKLL